MNILGEFSVQGLAMCTIGNEVVVTMIDSYIFAGTLREIGPYGSYIEIGEHSSVGTSPLWYRIRQHPHDNVRFISRDIQRIEEMYY